MNLVNIINEELRIINESVTDILYHITRIDQLNNILKLNKIFLSPVFGINADKELNKGKFYALSLTSSKNSNIGYAASMGTNGMVRLTMNGRELNNNYKSARVDYWNRPKDPNHTYYDHQRKNSSNQEMIKTISRNNELEDRIITDKNEIYPANKYIINIDIMIPNNNEENINVLKNIKFLADKLNIPIYFYNDVNYFNAGLKQKSVNIDSAKLPDDIETDKYSNKFGYYGLDILCFAIFKNEEILNKVLLDLKNMGEEYYDFFIKRYQKELDNLKYELRYNDSFKINDKTIAITSHIQNERSSTSEFTRYALKQFVIDMKKSKSNSIKKYIISKIWKGKKTQTYYNTVLNNELLNVIDKTYIEEINDLNKYGFYTTDGERYDSNITKEIPELNNQLKKLIYQIKTYCSNYILNNNNMYKYSYLLSRNEILKNINLNELLLPDYVDQEISTISNYSLQRVIEYVINAIDDFYYIEINKFQEEYQQQFFT